MSPDIRSVASGGALALFGLLLAGDSALRNEIGTLRLVGPGLFPLIVGVLLVVFGMLIALPALGKPGVPIDYRLREPVFVLAGVAAFAMAIRPLGLIPAIVITVFVSAFAERDYRPLSLAVLASVLSIIAWLTFSVGLGLPLTLGRWPF